MNVPDCAITLTADVTGAKPDAVAVIVLVPALMPLTSAAADNPPAGIVSCIEFTRLVPTTNCAFAGAIFSVTVRSAAETALVFTVTVVVFSINTKAGFGNRASDAGCVTPNEIELLVPAGVVTETLLVPTRAVEAIVNDALSDVALTTLVESIVIPVPDNTTLVWPARKSVPVRVTGTVVPRAPVGGLMEVNVGAGAPTVNVTGPPVPAGVVTETLRAPRVASDAILNVVDNELDVLTVTVPIVIPVPDRTTDV